MSNRSIIGTGACLVVSGLVWAASPAHAQTVCAASGSNTNYEWIDRVDLAGVTSFTGKNNGYAAPVAPVFALPAGVHNLTLTPGYQWGSYTEHWGLWIDLDQDGNFGPGEQLFAGSGHGARGGQIEVPAGTPLGETTMRVVMRYGSAPSACGAFYYGEVEDYVVDIVDPGPPTTVSTTTTIGFDHATDVDLAIVGHYLRDGQAWNASHFFTVGSPISRTVTYEVDIGTDIVWSGVVHLADIDLPPSACAVVDGDDCITTAGSVGELVEFAAPDPSEPEPPPTGDQVLTFEDIFGGTTYQAGPTAVVDGITVTTTGSYLYNNTAAPFDSDYFGFINAAFTFPAPVSQLSFEATGTCTNCTVTVAVSADGVVVDSFDLDYGVLSDVVLTLPPGTTEVAFDRGLRMDNLVVDYQ